MAIAINVILSALYLEHRDAGSTAAFAMSILIAALRHGMPFWASYGLASLWLMPAFFLHRFLVQRF